MPKASPNQAKIYTLMFVMMVNALAYGVIIPLLYPYASRLGINPLSLSWLFASFSLAQFIATPILGRLSDKFGRKPVLVICLLGTSLSLALFAAANAIWLLFVARILDGITGGNNSVAQAMVADTTSGPERAKAFGMLGAAFGFGFLFGPALGGLLSQYGMATPFWVASVLALVGTGLAQVILTETLPAAARKASHKEPLFRIHTLVQALFTPVTGVVLGIGLLTAIALNTFILGFQSYTVDVLKMNARDIGLLFGMFGIVTIVMQAGGIRGLLSLFKSKKLILTISLTISAIALWVVATTDSVVGFAAVLFFHMMASAPQTPMLTALLSERSKAEDQGGILGINQAYTSLGQIIGPLVAGVVSTHSVHAVFVLAGGLFGVAALATTALYAPVKHKLDL